MQPSLFSCLVVSCERVPLLFTIEQLVASGEPESFSGEFLVTSYRGLSFLDPKGRGGSTGDEEELVKENTKNASSSKGKITLSVTNTKPETGEVIGVFESVQPSDTDLGAQAPKDVEMQGIWYAQLESQAFFNMIVLHYRFRFCC